MKRYDHEKLGITFQELGALLGTRALLASGSVVHVAYGDRRYYVTPVGEHEFTMRVSCRTKGCGTVACIGGTMALIMGLPDPTNYVSTGGLQHRGYNGPLKALFYPDFGEDKHRIRSADEWDRITPTAAVHAIDAFLAGRQIKWRTLVKSYGLSDAQLKAKRNHAEAIFNKRDKASSLAA